MPRILNRNRLLVSVRPGMQSAKVNMIVRPIKPVFAGQIYRTKALIDSGSTDSVLGKKAWRALGLDRKTGKGNAPLYASLRRGQTMTASGRMMDLFYMPVLLDVTGRAPFKTNIAIQRESDLDVLGFTDMAKGDIQLR